MKILSVESSTSVTSTAIVEAFDNNFQQYKVLGYNFSGVALTHSQTLMPMVESMLKNTQIDIKEIDLLAVANGPGSFTGLRVGIAAVKGMALALNKPCAPVSTLHSLAFNIDIEENQLICSTIDARCNRVYYALFDHNKDRISDDKVVEITNLSKILRPLNKKIFFLGNGSELCYNEFSDYVSLPSVKFRYQNAVSVALNAIYNINKGYEPVDADNLLPEYLKLAQAEIDLSKRGDNLWFL